MHSSTGFAPSAVRFGVADTLSDRGSKSNLSQAEMLSKIEQNVYDMKMKQLRREPKQQHTNSLTIGKRFWFKNPDKKKSALEPVNFGPFTLVAQEEGKVVLEDIRGKQRTCHISEIHPFRGDE